jgi:hypothetical protein
MRNYRELKQEVGHFEGRGWRGKAKPGVKSWASLVRQKFPMREFAVDESLNLFQLVDPQ